jgi:hypothetical protein
MKKSKKIPYGFIPVYEAIRFPEISHMRGFLSDHELFGRTLQTMMWFTIDGQLAEFSRN